MRNPKNSQALLVLASSSPYRRALLERLQLNFAAAAPDVDERPRPGEAPRETALRLAEAKARTVAASLNEGIVIGSDQVATLENRTLGKPGARDAALEQLLAMRGRTVVFHTAVCLLEVSSGHAQCEEVPTRVCFRTYTEAQAARYLDIDRPYDCAGSAKIEALGIALVERVESTDPTALIGLPLIALVGMLQRVGVQLP